MTQSQINYNYYQVGGSVKKDHIYVVRQADDELYHNLKQGEFCYVLNSRQMGKSSLRIHTIKRLKQDDINCTSIDLTKIGVNVTIQGWYKGICSELLRGFNLHKKIDFKSWWESKHNLTELQHFNDLIEEILFENLQGQIIIFIDEIDSIIDIPFKDDFFAFIRYCFNHRAENPQFERLTFCLFGVATPSDLIQDTTRTPFNIGKSIQLAGFTFEEAKEPLTPGLEGIVDDAETVLKQILHWTGGQPFLTQKICNLIVIKNTNTNFDLDQLVQKYIIDNWESQDTPEHLKTLKDRLLRYENKATQLLGLYQEILEKNTLKADDSLEQMDLRLSGLVVNEAGKLRVYNPIYAKIFNICWIKEELAKLRPYYENINAWIASNFKDNSCLLRGEALQQALEWAKDKRLPQIDFRFLNACQQQSKMAMALEKQQAVIQLKAQQKANQNLNQVIIQAERNGIARKKNPDEEKFTIMNSLDIGTIITGRYKIIELLGEGTFGETYKAEDQQRFNEIVVVKRLKVESFHGNDLLTAQQLFKKEAQALQELQGYSLIPKLEAFYIEDSQNWFVVMEYIEGETLEKELERENKLKEQQVITLVKSILEIIKYVHERRLIHRDIKPNNIIRRASDDQLILIDFGAVKLNFNVIAPSNTSIGSIYAAPEQFRGKASPNSDIYAVGQIAIQALIGRSPNGFSRDSETHEIIWDYLAPDTSEDFKKIINKMIRYTPAQRYQSAQEVLEEINRIQPIITTEISKIETQSNLEKPLEEINQIQAIATTEISKIETQSNLEKPKVKNTLPNLALKPHFKWGGLIMLIFLAFFGVVKMTKVNSIPIIRNQDSNAFPFPKPENVLAGYNLTIGGSISIIPLNNYFKDKFETKYPGTTINTNINHDYQGSDEGIKALCEGKIDLASSSRPLRDKEACEGLKAIKIGSDAIVVLVTKSSNFKNINQQELQTIFRCEDYNFLVIYGSEKSGTQDVFEEKVLENNLGNCKTKPSNLKIWNNDAYTERIEFMKQNSKNDKRTYITYSPYGYASSQKSMKILSINELRPEDPNYPYQRPLYYVYKVDQQGNLVEPKVGVFLGFVGNILGF